MAHTLKRPKLHFNIKYISKINVKILKNNICISNIRNNILELKKEAKDINTEIKTLQNSLLTLKNAYSYTDFIEIKEQQILSERKQVYEKICNTNLSNINETNNTPTTKALTVVQTRCYFKYCKHYKKSCKIFIKIFNHIFNIILFKFLYIKNMIY